MDEQQLRGALFGMLPTPAYIFGAILFGVIGFTAYRYGKKTGSTRTRWLGAALMFYPYLIGSDTRILYLTGAALCLAVYFFRD